MRTHWQINPDITLKARPGHPSVFELKTPIYSISLNRADAIKLARALNEAITFIDEYESIAKVIRALDKAIGRRKD